MKIDNLINISIITYFISGMVLIHSIIPEWYNLMMISLIFHIISGLTVIAGVLINESKQ